MNTIFVDIDYPELIARKCEVIAQNTQLLNLIGLSDGSNVSNNVLYRSAHYIAFGCDLADTGTFKAFMSRELHANSCMVLCTAEVSITYMDTKAADALVACSAQYEDSTLADLVSTKE